MPIPAVRVNVVFRFVADLFYNIPRPARGRGKGQIRLCFQGQKMRGWPVSRILFRELPPFDDHSSGPAIADGI